MKYIDKELLLKELNKDLEKSVSHCLTDVSSLIRYAIRRVEEAPSITINKQQVETFTYRDKTDTENKRMLSEFNLENTLIFTNPSYEGAIVGISDNGNVIYDYDLMIEALVNDENMTEEEAAEFIDFNVFGFGNQGYSNFPIVMFNTYED